MSLVVTRVAPRLVGAERPNWLLACLVGLKVVFVLAVALSGTLWLVLAALEVAARPVRWRPRSGPPWLNRNLSSRTRATVNSVTSQLDAVGQVVGGPPQVRPSAP